MPIDKVIYGILSIGIVLGALDKITGNKYELGGQFDNGFKIMGPIALSMVGLVVLTPVISKLLTPIIIPLSQKIGIDPGMFASILSSDMGGYHLAVELSQNSQMIQFSGVIVASMLGCTITFSIPVGLGLIEPEDQSYFAKGLLSGFIMLPLGCIIGGLFAGIGLRTILINMTPIIILSGLLSFSLVIVPNKIIRCSLILGKSIIVITTMGLAIGSFQEITEITIIPGMGSIKDALAIVGWIGVTLLGSFPIIHLMVKIMERPLRVIGRKVGMNKTGTAGFVIALASGIPVFEMMKDMTPRGKVVNTAWLVCTSSALGGQLGFVGSVDNSMVIPFVVSKLSGGVFSLILAMLITKSEKEIKTNIIEKITS